MQRRADQWQLLLITLTKRDLDLIDVNNNSLAEVTRYELTELHSREFSYQNIMQKTRLRKGDSINFVLNELLNHGYIVRKRPLIFEANKSSFLSIFSYTDPGFVTYLSRMEADRSSLGFRLEGSLSRLN